MWCSMRLVFLMMMRLHNSPVVSLFLLLFTPMMIVLLITTYYQKNIYHQLRLHKLLTSLPPNLLQKPSYLDEVIVRNSSQLNLRILSLIMRLLPPINIPRTHLSSAPSQWILLRSKVTSYIPSTTTLVMMFSLPITMSSSQLFLLVKNPNLLKKQWKMKDGETRWA